MSKTKIVATIGPASRSIKTLEKMMRAGLRVARLNFSHGTHQDHALLIKNIRAAARRVGIEVAILQDLQGPRIRIGDLPSEGVPVKRGSKVALVGDKRSVSGYISIPIQYKQLYKDVKTGSLVLIEDGTIQLKVLAVRNSIIYCKTKVPGIINSHKGINVPGVTITVDVITAKDKKDLVFGQKQAVDYVALSFVKDAKDIERLRQLIRKAQKKGTRIPTKIIPKIERKEAIEHLPEIIKAADGVMVARGDLALEMPTELVPILQKDIIQQCLAQNRTVIVATQMLDSMTDNPRPTRAEVSDVANAVIDHTDGIMLSAESAMGKYPVETVQMMDKIARATEASYYDDFQCGPFDVKGRKPALAQSACHMYEEVDAKAMIVITSSGDSARLLSRHRPEITILALTPEQKTERQLALCWGVIAKKISRQASLQAILKEGIAYLKKEKLVKDGDTIIMAGNDPFGKIPEMYMVQVIKVGEKF